jgi:sec-independent protein translocase protein TatC
VAPGLRLAERRLAAPLGVCALALFAVGGGFTYFVMPIRLNFLAGFLGDNATFLPDLNAYLSFLILLIAVFGVTFEVLIVSILLVFSASSRRRG